MMLSGVFVLLMCAWACQGKQFADKMDRYLIACHTSDLTCFKRQYSALRDNVVLGNEKLAIDNFEPFSVQYGNDCVRIEGWTESELVGIGMDSSSKELAMVLELPVYFKQVKGGINCGKPEQEFTNIKFYGQNETLEFTGNATVSLTFPFSLLKKKGDVYLVLDEEEVDALMDIPIYASEDEPEGSEEATKLNQASDWAFDIVQHIEAARDFAIPFTSRLRAALQRIPFKRLMLLYPEEDYSDLQFDFIEPIVLCKEKSS